MVIEPLMEPSIGCFVFHIWFHFTSFAVELIHKPQNLLSFKFQKLQSFLAYFLLAQSLKEVEAQTMEVEIKN